MSQMECKVEKVVAKGSKTYAIIKSSRGMHEKVIAAFELNKNLNLKLEKVSGTIKTINDFLSQHRRCPARPI